MISKAHHAGLAYCLPAGEPGRHTDSHRTLDSRPWKLWELGSDLDFIPILHSSKATIGHMYFSVSKLNSSFFQAFLFYMFFEVDEEHPRNLKARSGVTNLETVRVSSIEKHKDQEMCPKVSYPLPEELMAEIEWPKHTREQPATSWVISHDMLTPPFGFTGDN